MTVLDKAEDDAKPQRAHSIVLTAGGDSAYELAWELRNLADQIERGELTVGCSGGPSAGSIYSYKIRPVTHDAYFAAINADLAERRAGRTVTPTGSGTRSDARGQSGGSK